MRWIPPQRVSNVECYFVVLDTIAYHITKTLLNEVVWELWKAMGKKFCQKLLMILFLPGLWIMEHWAASLAMRWHTALTQMVRTSTMTSSNGNIFSVTGHLCGEFTGHRWIPRPKASDADLLMFSLICTWINGWANNREAGDLRRHCVHYDVTAMRTNYFFTILPRLAVPQNNVTPRVEFFSW